MLNAIAELAGEEFLIEPADHLAESRQNTWHLGASPEQRAGLAADAVVAAFEAVARSLDVRLRPGGPVTFYVWHDQQVGALKASLTSLGPGELLFGAEYEPVGELAPIVEEFLADGSPGFVPWTDLEPGAVEEVSPPPFPVWVRVVA
ncbi:hypothetical protein [Amycolatopsis sp. NPDC004378]